MAKKPAVEEKSLAAVSAGALEAAPSFIPVGQQTGTENIGTDDVLMPRLALAQKMSPELDEEQDNYIEGLREGMFFNSLTKKIYGKGPIQIAVVTAGKPRYIEFIPREQGGGIKDMNVPANDPRTQFGTDGTPPLATKFYDYLVVLPEYDNELIALSLKGTSLKAAKRLNTLVKQRNAPIYSGVYAVTSETAENKKGVFKIYAVANAGWVSQELFAVLGDLHKGFSGKDANIHREAGDDDVDFPHGDNEKGM